MRLILKARIQFSQAFVMGDFTLGTITLGTIPWRNVTLTKLHLHSKKITVFVTIVILTCSISHQSVPNTYIKNPHPSTSPFP
jgi:hypothetical protein